MINCFLANGALNARPTSLLDPDPIGDTYVHQHFESPASITDPRTNYLNGLSGRPDGKAVLTFDKYFHPDALVGAQPEHVQGLFSIIEKATLLSAGMTPLQLDTEFQTYETTYPGYVAGSFDMSGDDLTKSLYIVGEEDPEQVEVPKWISFDCNINGTVESFRIWTDADIFLIEYPDTYLKTVIYPIPPNRLLDPNFDNAIDSASEAALSITGTIDTSIANSDNSGVAPFLANYSPNGDVWYELPFSVLYKGARPTIRQVRDYIRDDLLSKNLATEEVWMELLPNLFASARFTIVPIWDNTYETPSDITISSPILEIGKMHTILATIYPNLDEESIANIESFMVDSSHLPLVAIPDSLNDVMSLRAIHPTYVNVDASKAMFAYQYDATKSFNIALCNAIATIQGAASMQTFNETRELGINYLSFVVDKVEYLVIAKSSYLEKLNEA